MSAPLTIGPVAVDLARRTARTHDGRLLRLTGKEFALLAALVEARGAVRSRDSLMRAVLGRRWHADDRSIDCLVCKLRRALPPDDDGLPLVRTIRCDGYWMRPAHRPTRQFDRLRRARRFYQLRHAALSDVAGAP